MRKVSALILIFLNTCSLNAAGAENWKAYLEENEQQQLKANYETEKIKNIELENKLEAKDLEFELEKQKRINAELRITIEQMKVK